MRRTLSAIALGVFAVLSLSACGGTEPDRHTFDMVDDRNGARAECLSVVNRSMFGDDWICTDYRRIPAGVRQASPTDAITSLPECEAEDGGPVLPCVFDAGVTDNNLRAWIVYDRTA